jgi:hypothetical protein
MRRERRPGARRAAALDDVATTAGITWPGPTASRAAPVSFTRPGGMSCLCIIRWTLRSPIAVPPGSQRLLPSWLRGAAGLTARPASERAGSCGPAY